MGSLANSSHHKRCGQQLLDNDGCSSNGFPSKRQKSDVVVQGSGALTRGKLRTDEMCIESDADNACDTSGDSSPSSKLPKEGIVKNVLKKFGTLFSRSSSGEKERRSAQRDNELCFGKSPTTCGRDDHGVEQILVDDKAFPEECAWKFDIDKLTAIVQQAKEYLRVFDVKIFSSNDSSPTALKIVDQSDLSESCLLLNGGSSTGEVNPHMEKSREEDTKEEAESVAQMNLDAILMESELEANEGEVCSLSDAEYNACKDSIILTRKLDRGSQNWNTSKFIGHHNKVVQSLSRKAMRRLEVCVTDDISLGKEKIPMLAMNGLDDSTCPPFTYVTNIVHPSWYKQIDPIGCNCINGCSDSQPCPCILKNGGEIPYNEQGRITRARPIVHECGPSCKCSPSCMNRVSQHGPRHQLEIFKTLNKGWGVRSRNFISSGSFVCEYIGELLHDKEAEQRIGSDEYLFDIGRGRDESNDPVFAIDAGIYGNIGRFINHSCSPNLYAQEVLYDHDDNRMPHIMFFATKSIYPRQELSCDYNYKMNQVCDASGNIKIKNCYCGARKCTRRLY